MNDEIELHNLGIKYGTDKAVPHGYMRFYAQHFSSLKNNSIRLIEFGVAWGSSLRVWQDYFPNALIIGIDCNPANKLDEGRISTRIGSATDPELAAQIYADIGDIDVIIDDASHTMTDQIKSFEIYFPLLKHGGIYVIEDLHTSYWAEYGGDPEGSPRTTVGYLKKLIDPICQSDGSFRKGNIESICFYPSFCFLWKAR